MKITINDQLRFVGDGKSDVLTELNTAIAWKLSDLFSDSYLKNKELAAFLKPSVRSFGKTFLECKRLGKLISPQPKAKKKEAKPTPYREAKKKKAAKKS